MWPIVRPRCRGTQACWVAAVPELAFWAADGGPLTVSNPSGTIHLALFERGAQTCRSTIALAANATQFLAWRAHLEAVLGRAAEGLDPPGSTR